MSNIHDITDYRGEAKQEFIQSICDAQHQDGPVIFLDRNPLNIDLIDEISLLKDLSKHFRFSNQHNLQIIYRWHIETPDGVIAKTEEIGKINFCLEG